MGAPKNCAEAIAGMCRAVSALVILGLVALARGNQSKDAAPEVLLSQLPEEGFSYQDTDDVTSQDNYVASLQGQVGLNAKLKAAHHNEAQERRKADGLEGEMVLSSVGIEGGIQMPDDPTSDNFGEMELVQDWTPSGQPGLAEVLRKKHQEEHQRKLKTDGLEGKDADAPKPVHDDKEDLFGMVDIDVKLKADEKDDELDKLGIIDTKKIHFNNGKKPVKGWLSEDDIQLVQKH